MQIYGLKMYQLATVVLGIAFLQGSVVSKEMAPRELQKKLFSDYNSKVLPIAQHGDKVSLKAGLIPFHIHDLDEEKGILHLDSWIYMQWNDSQLTWSPASHGGVEQLVLPSSEVWKPDISVYNTSPSKKLVPTVLTNVIVNYTGMILWVPPFTISSVCKLEYFDYPEDVQHCIIRLGSWTYGSASIDINMANNDVSLKDFDNSNPTWTLEKGTVQKMDKYYDCCPNEYYTSLDYTLTLKRKDSGGVATPEAISVFAVFLALLMFWLPPGSTHKIILGALAEMLLGLETLYLEDSLQAPGAELSCTQKIYPFMCLVGVLLILETATINLSSISSRHRAPKWLLAAANGFCQPLGLCIARLYPERKMDEEESVKGSDAESEWKLVAMVIDRVLFFIALIIFVFFHKIL